MTGQPLYSDSREPEKGRKGRFIFTRGRRASSAPQPPEFPSAPSKPFSSPVQPPLQPAVRRRQSGGNNLAIVVSCVIIGILIIIGLVIVVANMNSQSSDYPDDIPEYDYSMPENNYSGSFYDDEVPEATEEEYVIEEIVPEEAIYDYTGDDDW